MAIDDLVAACRRAVDDELRACVGDRPSPFYDLIRYHLGWVDERGEPVCQPGGKMLRPVLCLLSCQAVGGDYARALPAAAAIEMVHDFSLIHDDIQDQSPKRRHRPTIWWLWGQAQAITAGDGLHVMSNLAHLRLLERGVEPDRVLTTLKVLDKACLDLCEGQYLDLSFEAQTSIGLEDYLAMVGKKTAALFAASTRIGAMLGAKDDLISSPLSVGGEGVIEVVDGQGVIEAMGRFGEELGMAFQIQDDILGIWGVEEATGKPSLDDIRVRKKSLPVVHAMATSQGRDRERLLEAYSVGEAFKRAPRLTDTMVASVSALAPALTDEVVASVVSVLEAAGSRDYCQGLAKSYWDRASSRLLNLSLEPEAARALAGLARELVERQV